MASILIIGAYPPPVGGNSVHIQRLRAMLLQDEHKCSVIDLYGAKNTIKSDQGDIISVGGRRLVGLIKTFYLLATLQYDIVHFHVSSMKKFLYIGMLYFIFIKNKSKKIITIHSGSFPQFVKVLHPFKVKMMKHIISRFDDIIVVSEELKKSLLAIGVREDVLHIIPAFLRPIPTSSQIIDDVITHAQKENMTIIVTSGYATKIYQYETIIDAILQPTSANVFLIICVYNEFDDDYFLAIEEKLKPYPTRHIIFKNIDEQIFAHILEKSDIYIRATTHDGDCVAIREANYFGTKVIASDCVKRPEFCLCFRTSDSNSLLSVLNGAIKEIHSTPPATEIANGRGYYDQILSVYRV